MKLFIIVVISFFCGMLFHMGAESFLMPPKANIFKIAETRMKRYCKAEHLSLESFESPCLYQDNCFDFCIEYKMKEGTSPRHVVFLFFKNCNIVEEHREIQNENRNEEVGVEP